MLLRKLIIKDQEHLNEVIKNLKARGFEVPNFTYMPFALILNSREKTVLPLKKEHYNKDGHKVKYFTKAEEITHVQPPRRRNRNGRSIRRSDGVVYENINVLVAANLQVNYMAKIYQSISMNKKMYGYHWEYAEPKKPKT